MSRRRSSGVGALLRLVQAQKRGVARGIYAVCSAHRLALEACMKQALQQDALLLVESTSNQVNQLGGYTGMTPAGFFSYLCAIAQRMGFPIERIILGGDHLGPNPWQKEPASRAMSRARQLVQECAQAGYVKFHLDASMRLGDDDPSRPLEAQVAAARAAELCQAVEEACAERPRSERPLYVIGTEVPPPGGARQEHAAPRPTRVEDVAYTLETTRAEFYRRGLQAAWERVIAVVAQPGVEFGDQQVHPYQREAAALLARWIESVPGMVFEAHSTDYQTPQALRQMVEDHFAILKVGPALTFALREAAFALAMIEQEWLGGRSGVQLSNLIATLEQAMLRAPRYWQEYYRGDPLEQALARKYSLSDRIRYYWPDPEVQQALARLLANLEQRPAPLSLISQYLPIQHRRLREGQIPYQPTALIHDHIMDVLQEYAWACRA